MNWVTEKEEWLADWNDARCLKTVLFEPSSGADLASLSKQDQLDIFYSDVIEAGGRCLVCRASGSIVDIFDISPSSVSLVSWRVKLPSLVIPDIGIAVVCNVDGASLSLFFLTKALVIHKVHVSFHLQVPDVLADSSTSCGFTSAPSAFCALDSDLAVVGCFDGTLRAIRLSQGHPGYEFSDASLVRRIIGGFMQPTPPNVLALASVGRVGDGFWMLAFSNDGQLRLWEASPRRGVLLASKPIFSSTQDTMTSLIGTSSTYMRLNSSRTKACLVLRNTIYLIQLPTAASSIEGSFIVREIPAPFPSAVPSLVALSQTTLWSFWSGHNREQLFNLDIEAHDPLPWRACALEAGLVGPETLANKDLCNALLEGCGGSTLGVAHVPATHNIVFTLHQQQEVWRLEEEGFDAYRVAEAFAGWKQEESRNQYAELVDVAAYDDTSEKSPGIDDIVLQWWLGRIFLPGRYSNFVIAAALGDAGARRDQEANHYSTGSLRGSVEDYVRKQAALRCGQGEDTTQFQVASAMAIAAGELLRLCDAVWRRRHQVCGMGASRVWAPHSWYPAGQLSHMDSNQHGVCPLLLCHGGVSCIRAVHSWAERWWATLHLTRDLSNYAKIEIEDALCLSDMDEWKLCGVAWFLSQCIGNSNSNLGMALNLLRRGTRPSSSLRRFVSDLPKHLAPHLKRVSKCTESPVVATHLQLVQQLLSTACSPEQRAVDILGKSLDPLTGTWSGLPMSADKVSLSDVLRGSIVTCETEYLCTSMRDLLLLCVYAIGDASMEVDGSAPSAWGNLMGQLDEQLPIFATLHQSMKMEQSAHVLPQHLSSRACDLWASVYVAPGTMDNCLKLGLRPPVASFKSIQFAMMLLRHECWAALRGWSKQCSSKEVAAYLAGRRWVSAKRFDAAREAFLHAESAVDVLMDGLHKCGLGGSFMDEGAPPSVAYYTHVAGLFAAQGQGNDEYLFTMKAATMAEEGSQRLAISRSLCQRLWSSAFEKAVNLEMWDKAYEILLRIESFESHLRLLGQRLRSTGRIDLLLKLPEKHLSFFMDSLHERASLSPPIIGSDSLDCYRHLYALHFSKQAYLKAASVAYSLHAALNKSLNVENSGHSSASGSFPKTGDCIVLPENMPKVRNLASGISTPTVPSSGFSPFAKAMDNVWPLLEQQRNALLMVISALSLTEEQTIMIPPPHQAIPFGASAAASGALSGSSPAQRASFKDWFSQAQVGVGAEVITLRDAERLLAIAEANLVLSGRSDLQAPTQVASGVSSLGLLGLALQVTSAYDLDPWESALQPFVRLCMESELREDDKVAALVDAARGPSQSYMFLQSDGCAPLGESSVRSAWWHTLEEGIRAASDSLADATALNGNATRLYSLAADEILASHRNVGKLPSFIADALSTGPSWVCLLRLYMKHERLEMAVELLEEKLKSDSRRTQSGVLGAPRSHWAPLQDFPVSLAIQLRRYAAQQVEKGKDGKASKQLEALDAILAQLQHLLEDSERQPLRDVRRD